MSCGWESRQHAISYILVICGVPHSLNFQRRELYWILSIVLLQAFVIATALPVSLNKGCVTTAQPR